MEEAGIRYLPLVGVCNAIFLVTYNIPNAIAGLYASPWPKDVTGRSYFLDGLCGQGTAYTCSGPGVAAGLRSDGHFCLDVAGNIISG